MTNTKKTATNTNTAVANTNKPATNTTTAVTNRQHHTCLVTTYHSTLTVQL